MAAIGKAHDTRTEEADGGTAGETPIAHETGNGRGGRKSAEV